MKYTKEGREQALMRLYYLQKWESLEPRIDPTKLPKWCVGVRQTVRDALGCESHPLLDELDAIRSRLAPDIETLETQVDKTIRKVSNIMTRTYMVLQNEKYPTTKIKEV